MENINKNNQSEIINETMKLNDDIKAEEIRNYREEMIEKYKDIEEEDNTGLDDFVEDNDKIALVAYCKELVDIKYKQYPDVMSDILIKHLYWKTIKNMDKEEYLLEKKRDKTLSVVERELQSIKDSKDLSYAINKD